MLIIDKPTDIIKYPIEKETDQVDILVKENTQVSMITYHNTDTLAEFKLNIKVERNANFTLYNIITSDEDTKYHVFCDLNDEGANFESLNVILCGKEAKYDSFIDINHLNKHTSSNLEIYAIAKDKANIVLNNNATIKRGCSKSIAHQKAKGLNLNKQAKIKALPNLYIDEYDVTANHAASIGSLNPDDLFYLMSRGLPKEEASKIIIMGFINPLVDCIKDEETKNMLKNNFIEKTIIK